MPKTYQQNCHQRDTDWNSLNKIWREIRLNFFLWMLAFMLFSRAQRRKRNYQLHPINLTVCCPFITKSKFSFLESLSNKASPQIHSHLSYAVLSVFR